MSTASNQTLSDDCFEMLPFFYMYWYENFKKGLKKQWIQKVDLNMQFTLNKIVKHRIPVTTIIIL